MSLTYAGQSQRPVDTQNLAQVPINLTPADIRAEYAALKPLLTPELALETKQKLQSFGVSETVAPRDMIAAIEKIPALRFLLAQDSRVPEIYTIAQHESNWLRAFERYLSNSLLPTPLTDSEMRLVGALHDIGKPLPDSKIGQHAKTLEVLSDIRQALPVEEKEYRIICSLIANDTLGRFIVSNLEQQASSLQRKEIAAEAEHRNLTVKELGEFAALVKVREPNKEIVERATAIAAEIRLRATALGISAIELFNLHKISYLADVAAYTYDAVSFDGQRGKPGLEFIFELNPDFDVAKDNGLFLRDKKHGAMKLSPAVAALFKIIEEAVR